MRFWGGDFGRTLCNFSIPPWPKLLHYMLWSPLLGRLPALELEYLGKLSCQLKSFYFRRKCIRAKNMNNKMTMKSSLPACSMLKRYRGDIEWSAHVIVQRHTKYHGGSDGEWRSAVRNPITVTIDNEIGWKRFQCDRCHWLYLKISKQPIRFLWISKSRFFQDNLDRRFLKMVNETLDWFIE